MWIFLPAAGYRNGTSLYNDSFGYYWSSSLDTGGSYSGGAYEMHFYSGGSNWGTRDRFEGLFVRPVSE